MRTSYGHTLLEALLALGATLLTVAVIAGGYRMVSQGSRGAAEANDLVVMVERIRNTFGPTDRYNTLTSAVAITAQAVPPSLVHGTTIRAEAGVLTLAPATVSVANDGFQITWPVRQEACVTTMRGLESQAARMSAPDASNVTRTVDRITGNSNVVGFAVTNNRAGITGHVVDGWIRAVCSRPTPVDITVTLAFL